MGGKTLITDTTQTGSVSRASVKFTVRRGEAAVIRSTNLDGSGEITLYYDAPDGSVDNPATYTSGTRAGTAVTLTPTYPEEIVNVPGDYRVAVTGAATTQGVVFVNQ